MNGEVMMDKVDNTRTVFQATLEGDMGSLGRAAYKLLRQHNFPHKYNPDIDILTGWDHDRIMDNMGCGKYYDIVMKYHPSNRGDLAEAVRGSSPDKVIEMFKELLDPYDKENQNVEWTGFRLMGTVNRSNGYPVYTIELFCNRSGVTVYSEPFAPNVKEFSENRSRRDGYISFEYGDSIYHINSYKD